MSTFLSATILGPKTGRMRELFVQEFVILLNEDENLRSLILEAVSKQEIGPGRARNNFRKLLKHFASDLRVEASEKVEDLQISQDPEFVKQTTPAHLNSQTYYDDTSDQIELSESDEEGDHDGVDEEAEPVKLDIDLTEHFDELKQFILDSAAYRTLRRRFDEFIRPSLGSKIEDLLLRWSRHDHRHHSFVARYKLFNLIAELEYANPHPQEIRLDEDNKRTYWQAFLDYYQKKAED
ncbi:hypothetical protein M431DRAFT_3020 [Trichoderma harzianum CBS 226.95]|uniref:Uncharacterized protein n=1 Tax=Trichoderma harzianum CBS 226.95 TaxID=983964 RepID=A0A2T4ALM5_TRIHA|nr:hypothetical protein M431DRAFT_3020 [Trichoderma harzianum CBS 226.95]PTB57986.1 hypothetical protein M431DRAFT_3020 [Trichoderma harzianum CBS 226.95]